MFAVKSERRQLEIFFAKLNKFTLGIYYELALYQN